MDASDILQDTIKLKERLENGLRQANDEYNFTVNSQATKLYPFYDENIDDAMVAYNYYEQTTNNITESIQNLEDCRKIVQNSNNFYVKSHEELNKKKLDLSLQFLAKNYIENNENKFKRRDRNDKQIQSVMKLIERENKGGGKCNTKKRCLKRNKKTHRKR
jgi:hypothetical protein